MVEDMDLLKHSPSWDDYCTRSTLHQISMAFLTILWSNWFLFHLFNYFDNASYFMWKVFGHKSGNWSDYENVLRWRIQGEGWRGPEHPQAPLLSRAVGIFISNTRLKPNDSPSTGRNTATQLEVQQIIWTLGVQNYITINIKVYFDRPDECSSEKNCCR